MAGKSAGILLYRTREGILEVLLVHPGGPFFAKKDEGVWTIPKGLVEEGEPELETARTSVVLAGEAFIPLGEIRQKGGKMVVAWAVEGDCDAGAVCSNTFDLEWPPGSGDVKTFPEIDRAEWFNLEDARRKMMESQWTLLDRLRDHVSKATSSNERNA
jgi:predicted NUDIX family NTP pyrophosphohydrolase